MIFIIIFHGDGGEYFHVIHDFLNIHIGIVEKSINFPIEDGGCDISYVGDTMHRIFQIIYSGVHRMLGGKFIP